MTEHGPSRPGSRRSTVPPQPPPQPPFLQRLLDGARGFVDDLGGMTRLLGSALRQAFQRPFEFKEIVYQLEQMGIRSIGITAVTAVFVGMVMTVQFAFGLERFGARDYVGRIIGLSVARELAPSLTALVVGSRIGSGMAAEIGSMAVTEQLDAIRALGAEPVKKLVVPRLLACLALMPILTLFADVLGFSGAMVVARTQFGTPMAFFFRTALESVNMQDFLSGFGKSPFFGAIVAIIGCYYGLKTRGGTEGVGRATTRTVVVAAVSVLVADFFLTKLFLSV